MNTDLDWLVGDSISEVELDEESGQCEFRTAGGAWLAVAGAWQVRSTQSVVLGSGDHGQQYGQPEPIDAEAKALELLAKRKISAVTPDAVSGDLRIDLDGGLSLLTFNDSSGFEGWHLGRSDWCEWIAMGGGVIAFSPGETGPAPAV